MSGASANSELRRPLSQVRTYFNIVLICWFVLWTVVETTDEIMDIDKLGHSQDQENIVSMEMSQDINILVEENQQQGNDIGIQEMSQDVDAFEPPKEDRKIPEKCQATKVQENMLADDVLLPKHIKDSGFPTTLEGFGYKFDDKERLRHIKSGEPYLFVVKENDHSYNQKRYDALGEVIALYIYQRLQKEEGMDKVPIPLDRSSNSGKSFIFVSKDWKEKEKLMLLIHGSGVVRAGQWSRRLILNDCLQSGTQIPYIRKAKEEGYGVIVLNPNQNDDFCDGRTPVKGNASPEEHFLYVWDHFVTHSKAKYIAIVAHSYGGAITLHGLKERKSVRERVFGIAFTDSVHSISHQLKPSEKEELKPWFQKNCKNWVSCKKPLGADLPTFNKHDCPIVSAGTTSHPETSWKAFHSVFAFLNEQFKKATHQTHKKEL